MTVLGKKINLAALLGALVVFFLPWLDMQCNGNSMVTQSGVQASYGGGSLSDQLKQLEQMGNGADSSESSPVNGDDRPQPAWLVAGGLLLVVLALILAVKSVFSAGDGESSTITLLSTMALGMVALQMVLGFPIEGTARQAMAESQGGADAAADGNPFAALGSAMVAIQVIRQPWLWIELALLAIPGAVWLNHQINRRNAGTGTSP